MPCHSSAKLGRTGSGTSSFWELRYGRTRWLLDASEEGYCGIEAPYSSLETAGTHLDFADVAEQLTLLGVA